MIHKIFYFFKNKVIKILIDIQILLKIQTYLAVIILVKTKLKMISEIRKKYTSWFPFCLVTCFRKRVKQHTVSQQGLIPKTFLLLFLYIYFSCVELFMSSSTSSVTNGTKYVYEIQLLKLKKKTQTHNAVIFDVKNQIFSSSLIYLKEKIIFHKNWNNICNIVKYGAKCLLFYTLLFVF